MKSAPLVSTKKGSPPNRIQLLVSFRFIPKQTNVSNQQIQILSNIITLHERFLTYMGHNMCLIETLLPKTEVRKYLHDKQLSWISSPDFGTDHSHVFLYQAGGSVSFNQSVLLPVSHTSVIISILFCSIWVFFDKVFRGFNSNFCQRKKILLMCLKWGCRMLLVSGFWHQSLKEGLKKKHKQI